MTLLALIFILALSISNLGPMQLAAVSRDGRSQTCRLLAESAVSQAIDNIRQRADWGKADPENTFLDVQLPSSAADEHGIIAFGPAKAASLGVRRSTNNLKGISDIMGDASTVVRSNTIHLLATGISGRERHEYEVILNIPRYPFVITSSDEVRSSGSLNILGVDNPAALNSGFGNVAPQDKKPGNLFSNSPLRGGNPAIELNGTGVTVYGDAEAVGDIRVGGGASVQGAVKQSQRARSIPDIDITQFDPSSKASLVNLQSSSMTSAMTLSGYNRRAGNLSFSNGLVLDGGVLYVDGDLNITGGLSGKGAVIATGQLLIQGSSQFQSDNMVAVLSGRSIQLVGDPQSRANYTGLLYSRGPIDISDSNVAGIVVANRPGNSSSPSTLRLKDSSLAYLPSAGRLNIPVKSTTTTNNWNATPPLTVSNPTIPGSSGSSVAQVQVLPGPNFNTYTNYTDVSQMDLIVVVTNMDGTTTSVPISSLGTGIGSGAVSSVLGFGTDQMAGTSLDGYLYGAAQHYLDRNAPTSTTTPGQLASWDELGLETWSLDLSNFIGPTDNMRVILWRQKS